MNTFKQQQESMRVSRADYVVVIIVLCSFALLFWSAIESLSQADSERAMRAARNDPMIVHQGNMNRK